MKTTKQSISSSTLFHNLFRSVLIDVQNKESVKRAGLISFVLLCILIKLILITPDKNQIRQNNTGTIAAQNLKLPLWYKGLLIKSDFIKQQRYDQFKIQSVKFNANRKSINSYNVN
jgi:hypothetical protein